LPVTIYVSAGEMGSYRHFTEVFFVVELIPKITSRTKRTNGTKYN